MTLINYLMRQNGLMGERKMTNDRDNSIYIELDGNQQLNKLQVDKTVIYEKSHLKISQMLYKPFQ